MKYIYVFRPEGHCDHRRLARSVVATGRSLASGTRGLWVTHTFRRPPASMLPLREGPVACLSVLTGEDEPPPLGVPQGCLIDGIYRAQEALPVRYTQTWPDDGFTPGVCLLTLFHRRRGLDDERFYRRWHVGHTGLSLKLHPLWHYNRNVVQLIGDSWATHDPYDGIVEEHFRRAEDLLNPWRFYGRFPAIVGNMARILVDILGFIDLGRIETYLARERIIKSPWAVADPQTGAMQTGRRIPSTDDDRSPGPGPSHPFPSDS